MAKTRCTWCGTDPLYMQYHDEEWGVPVWDDQTLFEFLILGCTTIKCFLNFCLERFPNKGLCHSYNCQYKTKGC